MGVVVHVINHSAQCRSIRLTPEDREDLVSEVFLSIVKNDFAILRHFREESSLATYLTVVARRIIVQKLLERKSTTTLSDADNGPGHASNGDHNQPVQRVIDRDEIERLMKDLEGSEAEIVRMYHLEGKSYQEISSAVGMPENSVGPTLSRARQKMRRAGADSAG
jgi:RNA polymerase sigma-70 factor (ECF subfamily)